MHLSFFPKCDPFSQGWGHPTALVIDRLQNKDKTQILEKFTRRPVTFLCTIAQSLPAITRRTQYLMLQKSIV